MPIAKPPEREPGPLTDRFEGRSRLAACAEQPEMTGGARSFPLESRAGGDFGEWIRILLQDTGEPLSETGETMKRILRVCEIENRTDRLVNRLVAIEKSVQGQLSNERAAAEALAKENRFIGRMLEDRDREFAALQTEFVALKRDWAWRTVRMIRCDLTRLRRLFRPSGARSRASQPGG
jgi:hypothetical protein